MQAQVDGKYKIFLMESISNFPIQVTFAIKSEAKYGKVVIISRVLSNDTYCLKLNFAFHGHFIH